MITYRCLAWEDYAQCPDKAHQDTYDFPFCGEHVKRLTSIGQFAAVWQFCSQLGCSRWVSAETGRSDYSCSLHGGSDFLGGSALEAYELQRVYSVAQKRVLARSAESLYYLPDYGDRVEVLAAHPGSGWSSAGLEGAILTVVKAKRLAMEEEPLALTWLRLEGTTHDKYPFNLRGVRVRPVKSGALKHAPALAPPQEAVSATPAPLPAAEWPIIPRPFTSFLPCCGVPYEGLANGKLCDGVAVKCACGVEWVLTGIERGRGKLQLTWQEPYERRYWPKDK